MTKSVPLLHTVVLDAEPDDGDDLGPMLSQIGDLCRALGEAGARLDALPAARTVDDLFVKEWVLFCDSGLGARALMCRPRGREAPGDGWTRSLYARGVEVDSSCDAPVSGTDVVWIPGRGALLGVGNGSALEAADALERFFDREVRCVEIMDPRFCRLDMAIASLDDGTVLACRRAFSPATVRSIEQWLDMEIVDVPLADALAGGLRWVQVGSHVVMGHGAPVVQALLWRRGLAVRALPLERVQRMGRGAADVVSRLIEAEAVLARNGTF